MSIPFRPISVTGVGVISCLGRGIDPLWHAVESEKTGIRNGLGSISFESDAELRNRAFLFSRATIADAISNAGWSSLNDVGLIIGTTTGQIPLWEKDIISLFQKEIPATDLGSSFRHQALGSILETVRTEFGMDGPSLLVSSACSAATQAIALGSLWIQQKKVKRCLVGGVEVLSQLTVEGFRSLQLLSDLPATPFDRGRKGINLSEGAAFLCLEEITTKPQAWISGFGMSSDAYHMTAPHPEGEGSFRAMKSALDRAKLSTSEISWVHAHGTGSQANDFAEGRAISTLFGTSAPWVSSTKGAHGHALGASGAIEVAICVEAFRHKKILKTTGLQNPDPEIRIRHPSARENIVPRHILKNTLGFGGNNAALVISHPDWDPR